MVLKLIALGYSGLAPEVATVLEQQCIAACINSHAAQDHLDACAASYASLYVKEATPPPCVRVCIRLLVC